MFDAQRPNARNARLSMCVSWSTATVTSVWVYLVEQIKPSICVTVTVTSVWVCLVKQINPSICVTVTVTSVWVYLVEQTICVTVTVTSLWGVSR